MDKLAAKQDEVYRLMSEACDVVQKIQKEDPSWDNRDCYSHPDVVAVNDRLRVAIAQRDNLLPDDHEEWSFRKQQPLSMQYLAEEAMTAALARARANKLISGAEHAALHNGLHRVAAITGRQTTLAKL